MDVGLLLVRNYRVDIYRSFAWRFIALGTDIYEWHCLLSEPQKLTVTDFGVLVNDSLSLLYSSHYAFLGIYLFLWWLKICSSFLFPKSVFTFAIIKGLMIKAINGKHFAFSAWYFTSFFSQLEWFSWWYPRWRVRFVLNDVDNTILITIHAFLMIFAFGLWYFARKSKVKYHWVLKD